MFRQFLSAEPGFWSLPKLAEKKFGERLSDVVRQWKVEHLQNKALHEYKKFSILLVATPQGGFGDVVFMKKFALVLKTWFPEATLSLMTNDPRCEEQFDEKNIYRCVSSAAEGAPLDKLSLTNNEELVPAHDITFLLPHVSIQEFNNWAYPLDMILSKLVAGVTPLNTFYVGEYNEEEVDICPRFGPDALGILLNDHGVQDELPLNLNLRKFVVAYVTPNVGRGQAKNKIVMEKMFQHFVKMARAKSSASDFRLTVIVPEEIMDYLKTKDLFGDDVAVEFIRKSDGPICEQKSDGPIREQTSDTKFTICFRGDILPVPHPVMMQLFRESDGAVLVTGDQSLTDAISYCSESISIWYQWTAWKRNMFKLVVKDANTKEQGAGEIKKFNKNDLDFRIKGKAVIGAAVQMAMGPSDETLYSLREIYEEYDISWRSILKKYMNHL